MTDITDVIDKITDNIVAIAVVGVGLGMAAMQITVPEWLVVSIGAVIAFYFKTP